MSHDCPKDGLAAFGLSACYYHLKEQCRLGDRLTKTELGFIGMSGLPSSGHGWRSADGLAATDLETVLGEEETALLQSLMRIGSAEQAEFLS